MKDEEIASKEACRILREHFIGLDHPNIDAYDDTYVINNYPFEWSLYMDGWKSENVQLKAEREWILCDDDMPEIDETVWITNGCGWTALGCLVECEGGYCWAVTNGIIYEEDGKIVSECELDDDYDVVFWQSLPNPPQK